MTLNPAALYAELYRVCTTIRCIPVFRGDQLVTVDPLTHEEATVLASALTVTVIDITGKAPA